MAIFTPWSAAWATMSGHTFGELGEVLRQRLVLVVADERVDHRHAELGRRLDHVAEVGDDLGAMVEVGVQRVRVVAERGDLDPPLGEVADEVLGLVVGQVGAVDVGHAGVAARRSVGARPAGDLEHREAVAGGPVGDLRQRRVREGGGQQAQPHRVAPFMVRCAQVRSTFAHAPGPGRGADRLAHQHGVVAVGERRVVRAGGRAAGVDVTVDVGEQATERVRIALDVTGGVGGRGDAGRGHDRRRPSRSPRWAGRGDPSTAARDPRTPMPARPSSRRPPTRRCSCGRPTTWLIVHGPALSVLEPQQHARPRRRSPRARAPARRRDRRQRRRTSRRRRAGGCAP